MENINYAYVSEQLQKIGWTSLTGSFVAPDSQWEHWRIGRRFTTYEAALCHNLLVAISKLNSACKSFQITRDKLRLFANGWSLQLEFLEKQDVFISINDNHCWQKKNNDGGRVIGDDKAFQYVESENDLDYYFLDYLVEVASKSERIASDYRKKGINLEPEELEEETLQVNPLYIKQAFVLEGIDEDTLGRSLVVLLNRDTKEDLNKLREEIKAISVASRKAQEALDRIISTVNI
jgi:hypothetical protein